MAGPRFFSRTISLDEPTWQWVDRTSFKHGTTPATVLRGCVWHVRRLAFMPPEVTLDLRDQARLFDTDPTLNRDL